MAVFPGRPDDTVRAAIAMQRAVHAYNHERLEKGRLPIRIGVGMHHGGLMLGIIGDDQRLDGAVVADAVNLASRMEGLTKFYGAGILVSGAVQARLEDASRYDTRFLDVVRVAGRPGAVSVFEILDAEPSQLRKEKLATREAFETGFETRRGGA